MDKGWGQIYHKFSPLVSLSFPCTIPDETCCCTAKLSGRQNWVVFKNTDSGGRLRGLKSQLYHLLCASTDAVPQFPHLLNGFDGVVEPHI